MLETDVEQDKLVSILHYSGMPITDDCIFDGLTEHLAKENAA